MCGCCVCPSLSGYKWKIERFYVFSSKENQPKAAEKSDCCAMVSVIFDIAQHPVARKQVPSPHKLLTFLSWYVYPCVFRLDYAVFDSI